MFECPLCHIAMDIRGNLFVCPMCDMEVVAIAKHGMLDDDLLKGIIGEMLETIGVK